MAARTTHGPLAPHRHAAAAGILCNDPSFQRFAAMRCGLPGQQFCASAAAQYLRDVCGIDSRRALDTDQRALRRYEALRTDFDAWAGRIAAPR